MYLISIKISGFKSFAEPVTIHVPPALSGIVGPNGSGKSNVVDAMRWVVGESSAKSLRGGTLDDVIFNGSAQRKPAGQASVELLFDNSLGRCGGQWENFAEVSIRRTVSRDGISEYFINGTRSRRRDVKELFLGTGFGPRSYSIIEQGMISRIVEGKPEDLSEFIEEASGVSRFREKRHETLLKLQRVALNLERLDDMRTELDKRLRQLKYQANQAQHYRKQKEKLTVLQIQLLAYAWQQTDQQVAAEQQTKSALEIKLEKRTAEIRALEADLEAARECRLALETKQTDVQMELFRVNAEIAECDKSITQYTEEMERTRTEIQTKTALLDETESLIAEQRTKAKIALTEHEKTLVQFTAAAERLKAQKSLLGEQEYQQQVIQEATAQLDQHVIEAVRSRETAFAALTQNQQELQATDETIATTIPEITRLESAVAELVGGFSDRQITEVERDCDRLRRTIAHLEDALIAQRAQIDAHVEELEDSRDSARETHVQLATLERSLGSSTVDDEEYLHWRAENQLAGAKELYESVTVADGWERAVDRVLGEKLSALCVNDLQPIVRATAGRQFTTPRYYVSGGSRQKTALGSKRLARFVDSPNQSAEALLAGVYTANTLTEALAMQEQLMDTECVVTADGSLMGTNWFAPAVSTEQSAGPLETVNLIRELQRQVAALNALEEERKQQIGELRELVVQQEHQLVDQRQQLVRKTCELEELRSARKESELQRLQLVTKLQELVDKEQQLRETQSRLVSAQEQLKQTLEAENDSLAAVEQHRQAHMAQTKAQTQKSRELQEAVNDAVQQCYQLELQIHQYRSDQKLAESSLSELEQRRSAILAEKHVLENQQATHNDPTQSLRNRLDQYVALRKDTEARLSELREQVGELEQRRRKMDEARLHGQLGIQELHQTLQEHNITLGRLSAQCEEIGEKLADQKADAELVAADLGDSFDPVETTAKLERLQKRLVAIGAVNLVAVEQYDQELQRKAYMDEQYDDLTRAMETLQQTIRKIDKEARHRYNETFSSVNSEFQRLLPKLFGGGSGHLELSGEYPDNIGLQIYARPKGKRIHNIQALSGGEKALTAVALILSMFQLNPSPVCLLDEIDAPLDDDNVYRLCDSLHALSDATQMILITHNKITMEAVDTLIGVTMPEPNVSKVLSVDLLEAQEFAA